MKLFSPQRIHFPHPEQTTEDGLVAISDQMSVEILLEAYSHGIFPWPHEDYPTLWFCPIERGILDFTQLHCPKSFQKFLRKHEFKITFNRAFEEVIHLCAHTPRQGEQGTWINKHMQNYYIQFHQAGYAHSVECWEQEKLVGGLYGVYVGGVFSGESMFSLKSNTSKLCLWSLIQQLQSQGITWMDIQMVTDVLHSFGGRYVPRKEFLQKLKLSQQEAQAIAWTE